MIVDGRAQRKVSRTDALGLAGVTENSVISIDSLEMFRSGQYSTYLAALCLIPQLVAS